MEKLLLLGAEGSWITEDDPYPVGRGQFVQPNASISAEQVLVGRSPSGDVYVIERGSRNGTLINGRSMTSKKAARYAVGIQFLNKPTEAQVRFGKADSGRGIDFQEREPTGKEKEAGFTRVVQVVLVDGVKPEASDRTECIEPE